MNTNDLTKELGQNFIEYAVAVNSDRAIPDATSGLKPVAKRILWAAQQMNASSSKPHSKCAMIVGEVMGKYHPHGDSSIYGALARLSQDWVMRYPLIDFHGNNGNIIGANPSAYRYTEARLSKLSEDGMLAGIKKKNVEFGLNFSDSLDEPVTLPSIFPNLLCNPNTGIGVAMACNWAPHNLGEVAQAIYDSMDGKEPMLPGPDFPTGGVIINKNDIPKIMQTGRGSVKIRGKYNIEKNKIVFYEVPYGVTIENLLENIATACDAKEVEGVSRIYDDSNKKKGVRLVIECDKTAIPEEVVQKLFAKTDLQSSFSYNQVALIDKTPTELNLKDCIKVYIDHNTDCIKREAQYDLDKTQARLHIVDGLLVALEDIDNVIQLIRASESPTTAKSALMNKYNLDDIQAQAILDMKLSKLARLEKVELENEKKELLEKIASLKDFLVNKELQLAEIRGRLEVLVKKYGDSRKTELQQIDIPKEKKIKPEVIPEDCVLVVSSKNTVKRIPKKSFKAQKRNTVGVKTSDITLFSAATNTQDTLMIFTSKGKMYRLLVDTIPEGTNTSVGTPLSTLIEFDKDEVPMAYTTLERDSDKKFIFFATKRGIIKKVPLEEYDKMKRTGIIAINFKEGDELADVTFVNQEEMMLVTKKGMCIRFAAAGMPISSRIAQGVKGMNVVEDDQVIAALPISNPASYLAIVSESGMGKKTKLEEFTTQNRGGKGLSCYKGDIAGAVIITEEDNILINGDKTSIVIANSELPILGRTSTGNTMLKNNTAILSISRV